MGVNRQHGKPFYTRVIKGCDRLTGDAPVTTLVQNGSVEREGTNAGTVERSRCAMSRRHSCNTGDSKEKLQGEPIIDDAFSQLGEKPLTGSVTTFMPAGCRRGVSLQLKPGPNLMLLCR